MSPNANNRTVPCALCLFVLTACAMGASADDALPVGSAPKALDFPWFPDRVHAFVWRNWELVDLPRMAAVLKTTPENVRAIGESMGLPAHLPPSEGQRRRGYITLIRRNWHLLPYEQMLELLEWTPQRLAETLKEDDFLWQKLGRLKPACPPLRYAEPTQAARQRAAEIKAILGREAGDELRKPARPRFEFVGALSESAGSSSEGAARSGQDAGPTAGDRPIRLIYSYFAVYGDPLSDPELDPYPEGLLERLAARGVNAVWMHTVLRDLAPSSRFPEFGAGHEKRLENLRKLVQRAKRHGIDIILYMNEPRCMPPAFFEKYPQFAGARGGDNVAMCTSQPEILQWLIESLAYVFKNVPDLGGVFTITASENLTSCGSHYQQARCPRCSKRSVAEIIAETNQAIAAGVRQGSPNARVICWDWGWPDNSAEAIIKALPEGVRVMSVSEWSLPINRGGVASAVSEYSLSAVGPGPRATRHWKLAQDRGLATMAKVQVNCTWELSAVPWLPVTELVAQHCENLCKSGVKDMMLSWTVGGYPSPNLQLVREFTRRPDAGREEILEGLARERYGAGASAGREAWSRFSQAFTEYPYHSSFLYSGPMQCGPANPLYPQATGYRATMVGFPYDDVDGWRAIYPAEVLAGQLSKVADGWMAGLEKLRQASQAASGTNRQNAEEDLRIAEAALLHFRSGANQVRFIIGRNALAAGKLKGADAQLQRNELRQIVADELSNARRLYILTKQDARIGFEPSNHYYYLPVDLLEKLINCRFVLDELQPGG